MTAIINCELKRLDIVVATLLQQTRLAADGALQEEGYTFYWQSRPEEEPRMHGVGLAVKNSLAPIILPPCSRTERILSPSLSLSLSHLINIDWEGEHPKCLRPNAVLTSGDQRSIILRGPEISDFNARVRADLYTTWPSCLGHFSVGKMNDNRQRLLELFSFLPPFFASPMPSSTPNPSTKFLGGTRIQTLAPNGLSHHHEGCS